MYGGLSYFYSMFEDQTAQFLGPTAIHRHVCFDYKGELCRTNHDV